MISASGAACGFEGSGSFEGVGTGTERGAPGLEAGASADGAVTDSAVTDPDGSLTPDDASAGVEAGTDSAVPRPATCAEVPASANSDVTLYVAHNPAQPWAARCGASGETYLPLPAGTANNFSTYPAHNCAKVPTGGGGAVQTTWTRVRIDPVTLVVTTNDYAGATSTGSTHEVSGNGAVDYTYTKVPFATGRTCENDNPATTVAKVDLTGTKFRIAPNQFLVEGFWGTGTPATAGAVTTLALTGFPAGMHSCRPAGKDYFQRDGGACLQLQYVP